MRIALLMAVAVLSGCGTIDNMIKGPRVYGGVKTDLRCMKGLAGAILIFDLPFSAIFDTVLLPVTIWFEIFREKEPERPDRWSPLDEKVKP